MNASNGKSNCHGNFALSRAGHTAVLAAGFALLNAGSALATTITPNGVTNIPSTGTVGIAGTIGTSGYFFVGGTSAGTATDTPSSVLPNWVTSPVATYVGTYYTSASYSSFSLSTGSSTSNYTTSVDYHTNANASLSTLATVTLSNSNPIPASFQIGILSDNSSSSANDTQFYLTEMNGSTTVVTQTELSLDTDTAAQNNFYTAIISGASPGDTIQIIGGPIPTAPSPVHYDIGGVTFDVVPEPTTLSLLGLGCIGLLARRRRAGAPSLDRSPTQ
jgi:hypothetical protein